MIEVILHSLASHITTCITLSITSPLPATPPRLLCLGIWRHSASPLLAPPAVNRFSEHIQPGVSKAESIAATAGGCLLFLGFWEVRPFSSLQLGTSSRPRARRRRRRRLHAAARSAAPLGRLCLHAPRWGAALPGLPGRRLPARTAASRLQLELSPCPRASASGRGAHRAVCSCLGRR